MVPEETAAALVNLATMEATAPACAQAALAPSLVALVAIPQAQLVALATMGHRVTAHAPVSLDTTAPTAQVLVPVVLAHGRVASAMILSIQ